MFVRSNVAGFLVLLGWVVGGVAYAVLPEEFRVVGTAGVLLLYFGALGVLFLRVLTHK